MTEIAVERSGPDVGVGIVVARREDAFLRGRPIGAQPQQGMVRMFAIAGAHVALSINHIAAVGIGHQVMWGMVRPLFGVFPASLRRRPPLRSRF